MKKILLTLSLSTCLLTYTHAGIIDTIKNFFSKSANHSDQQTDTETDNIDFGINDQANNAEAQNTDPQPSVDSSAETPPQPSVQNESTEAEKIEDDTEQQLSSQTEVNAPNIPDQQDNENTVAQQDLSSTEVTNSKEHADSKYELQAPDSTTTTSLNNESTVSDTTMLNNADKQKSFDIRTGFADVVEGALPAVVNVSTTQVMDKEEASEMQQLPNGMPGGSQFEELFRKFLEQNTRPRKVQSLGSGFIIKVDAEHFYVVTNNHVVQDAKTIKLHFHDKTELLAQVHASDDRTDIAVIKAKISDLPENKRNLTVFQWSTSKKDRVGDWVIAIGNPFGFGSSVTTGIISGKGRDILSRASGSRSDYVDEYIQHSAQINFGNSGGCLLDTDGHVLGINTAIISPSGGNVGIGFAIPASIASKTVNELITHGRTRRGWLGVKIQPFTEEMAESIGLSSKQSAIVAEVIKGGPAEKAGIEKDDIIIEFNGTRLEEGARITRLVGEADINKPVPLKVWRKGKILNLSVTLGEYEDAEEKGLLNDATADIKNVKKNQSIDVLGITVAPRVESSKDGSIKGGVSVLKVDPMSTASELGLQQGDIILEANQKEINKPKDLQSVIEDAKKNKRKHILLLVVRQGEPRYAPLKIESDEADNKKKNNDTNVEEG